MSRLYHRESDSQFLQTAEVASLIGISKQTIFNWLREGRLLEPERNPVNNYRRWTEQDVARIRDMIRERSLDKNRRR